MGRPAELPVLRYLYARGQGAAAKGNPSEAKQPEPPRGSMGPVTPEEQAQWGGQQSYLSSDVFTPADKARLLKEVRSGTFGTTQEMVEGLRKHLERTGAEPEELKRVRKADEAIRARRKGK